MPTGEPCWIRHATLFSIGYGTADLSVLDGIAAAPRRLRTIPHVPAGGFASIVADPLSDLLYLPTLYSGTVHVIVAGTGALRPPISVSGAATAVVPTGIAR